MIMKSMIILLSCIYTMQAEDFISKLEYGQMLYKNTREVSCVPCHGDRGEGKEITSYRSVKGSIVTIDGPNIQNSTLKQLSESLAKGKGIMPKYYFTEKEIEILHSYLLNINDTH